MKKYIPLLFLAGCCNVPVVPSLPDPPKPLTESCPDLTLVQKDAQMSDVLETVVDNYAKYHECKLHNDVWVQWYKEVKKSFDDASQ